jgi:hypothetical protein
VLSLHRDKPISIHSGVEVQCWSGLRAQDRIGVDRTSHPGQSRSVPCGIIDQEMPSRCPPRMVVSIFSRMCFCFGLTSNLVFRVPVRFFLGRSSFDDFLRVDCG